MSIWIIGTFSFQLLIILVIQYSAVQCSAVLYCTGLLLPMAMPESDTVKFVAPLSQGFGYGIILGLGFAFALVMIFITWALKRYVPFFLSSF